VERGIMHPVGMEFNIAWNALVVDHRGI
jgi:hypothetical protein